MAEYFPLLERAVAGLREPTAEVRKGLYDRARSALLSQLRGIDPPVPEEEVQRESVALDEAISRVEAKFRKDAQNAAPRPRPLLPPPDRPAAAARPMAPARTPAEERPSTARPASPPVRQRPAYPFRDLEAGLPRSGQPVRADRSGDASQRGEPVNPRIPVPDRQNGTAPRLGPVARVVESSAAERIHNGTQHDVNDAGSAPPIISGPSAAARPMARPANGARDLDEDQDFESGVTVPEPRLQPDDDPGPSRRRNGDAAGQRPAAPVPKTSTKRGAASYILMGLAVLVIAGIAVAAYKLRDRPEQVAGAHPAVPVDESPSKIVKRVDGPGGPPRPDVAPEQPATTSLPSDSSQAGSTAPGAAPETGGGTTVVPAPIPQGSERAANGPQATADNAIPPAPSVSPGSTSEATAPSANTTAGAPDATSSNAPAIGVSQRAGMLVDAPEEPQKVKTFQGQVVWRTDSVSAGQGQPLSNAVRADVDIPDARLTMSMVLKKNLEPQFPASHTIEFHFTEQPGNTLGPVKQINVPEMRLDDASPNGDPLVGVPVAITDDYFLVGLSRGPAEQTNTQLMTGRNWIDLSILLTSGKIAKVTFEKGPTGQKILDDAIASWR